MMYGYCDDFLGIQDPSLGLEPLEVPRFETPFRRIGTCLPVPESLPYLERRRGVTDSPPLWQPPVMIERVDGSTLYDGWGNRWINLASGALGTGLGWSSHDLQQILGCALERGLPYAPASANVLATELGEALAGLSPSVPPADAMLTGGGVETLEAAARLCLTHALHTHGPQRRYLLLIQPTQGRPGGRMLPVSPLEGLGHYDDLEPRRLVVPFPGTWQAEGEDFSAFLGTLERSGILPQTIAGVIASPHVGGASRWMPVRYAEALQAFCRRHGIVLAWNEADTGLARSGRMFSYEHLGLEPDLVVLTGGLSPSFPLGAILGRAELLALAGKATLPGLEPSSFMAVMAGMAHVRALVREQAVARAERLGACLEGELKALQRRHPHRLSVGGRGLLAWMRVLQPYTTLADDRAAYGICREAFHRGVYLCPTREVDQVLLTLEPALTITEAALLEAVSAVGEAVDAVFGRRR